MDEDKAVQGAKDDEGRGEMDGVGGYLRSVDVNGVWAPMLDVAPLIEVHRQAVSASRDPTVGAHVQRDFHSKVPRESRKNDMSVGPFPHWTHGGHCQASKMVRKRL
jgi:hypothetical protein